MGIHFEAPLLKWGNSYALRITRAQAEELGVRPGQTLAADVRLVDGEIPKLYIPPLHATDDDPRGALEHDELIGELLEEEWKEWQGS